MILIIFQKISSKVNTLFLLFILIAFAQTGCGGSFGKNTVEDSSSDLSSHSEGQLTAANHDDDDEEEENDDDENPGLNDIDFIILYRLFDPVTGLHRTAKNQSVFSFSWDKTYFVVSESWAPGFTQPLFQCVQNVSLNESADKWLIFESVSQSCEGQLGPTLLGYISPVRTTRAPLPLYRCYKGETGHFITVDPLECQENGFTLEGILGYVVQR